MIYNVITAPPETDGKYLILFLIIIIKISTTLNMEWTRKNSKSLTLSTNDAYYTLEDR